MSQRLLWGELEYPIQDVNHYNELMDEIHHRRSLNLSRKGRVRAGESPFKQICREVTDFKFLPLPAYSTTPSPNPHPLDNQALSLLTNLGPPRYSTNPIDSRQVSPPTCKIVLLDSLTPYLTPDSPDIRVKSQVWRALVNGSEVVIKIYFSCFHYPWWSKVIGGGSCVDFFPEEGQAHREAWAYNLLKVLQGTRIPRSFGFYEVSESHVGRLSLTLF